MGVFHISQIVQMVPNHVKRLIYSTNEFHTNWGLTKVITKKAGHYETHMKRMDTSSIQ